MYNNYHYAPYRVNRLAAARLHRSRHRECLVRIENVRGRVNNNTKNVRATIYTRGART